MKRESTIDAYIDAVEKEIDIVCKLIDKNRKIAQIHYGGGSPTSIPLHYIKRINEKLMSKFECIKNPEIAIECHAGYLVESDFQTIIDAGFNRVSIGIQDFNKKVLAAANRIPTNLPIEDIFEILRKDDVRINLDFIYGLPLQTHESFYQTIEKAINLAPDRLVTFSYAHVPNIYPLQKKMERHILPSDNIKNDLYKLAQKMLLQNGYYQIGLDHYVKPQDELLSAQQNSNLHRNFQGYCTRRTTGQVYAFGVTAISQLTSAYAQNTKDIDEYIVVVNNGQIPVKKGYTLNSDEQITREVITDLMCNDQINWQQIAQRLNSSAEQIKAATAYNYVKLQNFASDGIIFFDDNMIKMQHSGSPFVRNVAASLDKLLIETDKTFSKPI